MGILTTLLGGLAAGTGSTLFGNKAAMERQLEAQDFQEYMASTNVQRTAADMEAAGINKNLAVQTGTVQTAATQSGKQGGSNDLLKAIILKKLSEGQRRK